MRDYRGGAMLESGQIIRKCLKGGIPAPFEPETEVNDEAELNVLSLCSHVAHNVKQPLRVQLRDQR